MKDRVYVGAVEIVFLDAFKEIVLVTIVAEFLCPNNKALNIS